ncbi:MAG: mucin desulfatase, partial [Clostridia bacterium]|nr:mucin desulfatase [Clostridia bacterium]
MENVVVLQEILNEYSLKGEVTGLIKIEIGHINDTYCLSLSSEGVIKRYILQKINNKVFKDIEGLIANIVYVTSHLRGKLIEASRDPSREAMRILPTFNGRYYYLASDGGSYRIYDYIEGSVCHLYAE